jgi:plasmid stabilization system protein ParE
VYKEKWSPRASSDYRNILSYILSKWSEKEALEYIQRIEQIISLIRKMPEMYKASRKGKNIRQCVVNSQTSLYYRIHKDTIEIITIFDNRQNPEKLKKEL